MGATKIMVIRHAEKPGRYSGAQYAGVNDLGTVAGGRKDVCGGLQLRGATDPKVLEEQQPQQQERKLHEECRGAPTRPARAGKPGWRRARIEPLSRVVPGRVRRCPRRLCVAIRRDVTVGKA
jgi:hypothetical protein